MKGLNLGCGPIYLEKTLGGQGGFCEWENSDFADTEPASGWKIDRKRDFLKRQDDLEDNSIDYIVAWHIYEHIPMHLTGDVMQEWKRILKPGGMIFLACPDIKKIAQNIINPPAEAWHDWFICMVNIFGPYNGFEGDLHRWGYCQDEIERKFMMEAGFSSVFSLFPQMLEERIGQLNARKLGFADYNVQAVIVK